MVNCISLNNFDVVINCYIFASQFVAKSFNISYSVNGFGFGSVERNH